MAANPGFGEAEKMSKPSGSGFGSEEHAELSTIERKEKTGFSRGRSNRQPEG